MVNKITVRKITSGYKHYLLVALLLITFVAVSRLLPHPPNFAPVAAVAIFAGALLPRRWALSLPLAAMIISDALIGFHDTIFFTWGSFALIAVLSHKYLHGKLGWANSAAASIGASILFFVVTNFGVWLQSGMYARTLAGLVECYYMALPFFRNTVLGDMVYTLGFFGLYVLIRQAYGLYQRQVGDTLSTK